MSADDFFLDPAGNYVYIPHLISKAHEWARAKVGNSTKLNSELISIMSTISVKKAMKQRKRIVISDNTNTQVRKDS